MKLSVGVAEPIEMLANMRTQISEFTAHIHTHSDKRRSISHVWLVHITDSNSNTTNKKISRRTKCNVTVISLTALSVRKP